MQKTILSIIIPVYNVEKYLERCLESVVPQLTDSIEVLLINDGSTDKSGEICSKYAKNNANILYIEQKNKGLSGARNTGIKHSKGEYLLFLDSDDCLNPLLNQLSSILLSNVDVVLTKATSYDDITKQETAFPVSYKKYQTIKDPAELFYQLDKNDSFWFAAWLVIIKKDFLIQKNLFFKEGIYHEDELWVPLVFAEAQTVALFDEELYWYRTSRDDSIMNKANIKKSFDKIIVMEELSQYIDDTDHKKNLFLKNRLAALEWGLINSLDDFRTEKSFNELHDKIEKKVIFFKNGKYYCLYLACKFLGIKNISRLFKDR